MTSSDPTWVSHLQSHSKSPAPVRFWESHTIQKCVVPVAGHILGFVVENEARIADYGYESSDVMTNCGSTIYDLGSTVYPGSKIFVYRYECTRKHPWEFLTFFALEKKTDRQLLILSTTSTEDQAFVFLLDEKADKEQNKWLLTFEPSTLTWREIQIPSEDGAGNSINFFDGFSACIIKGKIYVYGGYAFDPNKRTMAITQDICAYSIIESTWHCIQATNNTHFQLQGRYSHSAIGFQDRYMAVTGGDSPRGEPGRSLRQASPDSEPFLIFFDTLTSKWKLWSDIFDCDDPEANEPESRFAHSSFLFNDHICIFGGKSGANRKLYADLHCFDLRRGCWREVLPREGVERPLPVATLLRFSCNIFINGRLFVFGGYILERDGYLMDVFVLDMEPSLVTMAMIVIREAGIDEALLPKPLRDPVIFQSTVCTVESGTETGKAASRRGSSRTSILAIAEPRWSRYPRQEQNLGLWA